MGISIDGSVLIKGKRCSVLNTRLQSRIKNDVEFDEIRFLSFIGPQKIPTPSVWEKQVHASFRKVVAFDLLFMMLGALIGAGIITTVLR
jgi:hypothetical protein